MEEEIDPYERQLLAVFKSCDRDGSGILDLNGFGQLCDALQLEENHRSQLVKRLCTNGKCSVAFSQFRDALLAVLASLRSTNEELNNQNASNYELTGLCLFFFYTFFPQLLVVSVTFFVNL